MKMTYASHIKHQLTSAGFSVTKNTQEKSWEVADAGKVIMYNASLGVLMNKASKEFGLNNWESK
jgi:hypothetical protein